MRVCKVEHQFEWHICTFINVVSRPESLNLLRLCNRVNVTSKRLFLTFLQQVSWCKSNCCLIFFAALMSRMVRPPTAVPWMVQVHLLDWFYRTCRPDGNPSSTAPTQTSSSLLNHSPGILLSPANCEYALNMFFTLLVKIRQVHLVCSSTWRQYGKNINLHRTQFLLSQSISKQNVQSSMCQILYFCRKKFDRYLRTLNAFTIVLCCMLFTNESASVFFSKMAKNVECTSVHESKSISVVIDIFHF